MIGTPDKVRERIKEYLDAGVEQFFLAFHDPFNHHDLELFMDTVKWDVVSHGLDYGKDGFIEHFASYVVQIGRV